MLSLRIALRYLFSRKSHSAVNIISFISLAGVAVATVAIVCVLSVFNGFHRLAESRLSQLDAQLQVTRADGRMITDADSLAAAVAGIDGVAAALPTLTGQALATYHDKQMPVRIKGVPRGYDEITGLRSLIIDGEYLGEGDAVIPDSHGLPERSYAALSVGVAVSLSSPAGFYDFMGIYAPRRVGRINPANPLGAFSADSVVVSAVFQVDQPEYDADLIILPLADVRALLEYDTEASAIEIALLPGVAEPVAARAIAAAIGPGYRVKDRLAQQAQSFRMIRIEKWISFLLLAFILIIASFNIISTLSILIIEKQDNIATMLALGAPRRLITRIFMLEGWLVSLGGGIAGIVIGVALCLVQQHFGIITLSGDASKLTIDTYPVAVEPTDLIAVMALVALIGLLSTLVTRRFVRSKV